MKKIMSLVVVALFSVSCASHKCSACAGESCGCGKDKGTEKACSCGAKDKKDCKCGA